MHKLKCIKLYTLNMYHLLYVKYISIKLQKQTKRLIDGKQTKRQPPQTLLKADTGIATMKRLHLPYCPLTLSSVMEEMSSLPSICALGPPFGPSSEFGSLAFPLSLITNLFVFLWLFPPEHKCALVIFLFKNKIKAFFN